ncbi:Transcription factor MADS-box [Arabidopsis thaliana x Arabidopsis arenosa]|uniref:Transcription factor MADS-box n=1 Tax=Arabidopsis thaliana x Arabidopsis arenosa TaxID=1240361 RepID=A0A8T1YDE1_9BRAS|nr:Transcription factor MADS-box [Arabidopsis thaliana x Arabidopsis arenosa]
MTMRSLPSSSSSSSYSLASTSLSNRLETIFKKASELCTLCDIEACVIYYGPDGELKTWPKEREKVRDIALRYSQLKEALRRKKSVNLNDFLTKKKNKETKNPNKKRKTSLKKVNELKYPIADHYSPDQVSQLIQSLELNVSKVQERLRFVESQKHKETKPDHQSLASSSLNHQTQSLNPSQFSLFMYNHGDNTLSQIPVSASNFKQDFSALLQQSELKNQLVKQEFCGYDQNMCMSNITNNSFQHPCVSNKEHYSAVQEPVNNYELNQLMQNEFYGCDQKLSNINSNNFQHPCVSNTQHNSAVQESLDNYGLNQLMQHELYGFDQNLCTSDITNSNVPNPSLSYELGSDFHDSCGNMVGNTSFSQDMCSSYVYNFDESSLLQTSTLPYLSTVPNSYLLSGNSS